MADPRMKKRAQTISAIATVAMGTGSAAAAPTPLLELPKQGVIALGDLALCITIYTIWFDTSVTTDQMRHILIDAGVASMESGLLVYAGVKATEALLAEGLNLLGPLGWGVSAVITGTVTATVGLVFWRLCEDPPAWLIPDKG
jgi:hypothetical protein